MSPPSQQAKHDGDYSRKLGQAPRLGGGFSNLHDPRLVFDDLQPRGWRNADPGPRVGGGLGPKKKKFNPWENVPKRQLEAQIGWEMIIIADIDIVWQWQMY